jgi:GT2 family glycosyltransferase
MMLRVIAAGATPPRGVILVPGVALIAVTILGQNGSGAGISFRGQALLAPYGTVTIETEPKCLQIAAVRLPAGHSGDLPLLIESDHGEHLPLYLSELGLDPLAIAAGLDTAARWRLLEFLLNFCCAAFRLRQSASFAEVCMRLALDCTRNAGIATVEAQVLAGRVLLSGMDVPRGSTLSVIGRTTVTHSSVPVLETGRLQVLPRVRSGDLIVASGPDPVVWTVDEPASSPHVLSLTDRSRIPGALARAACRQALGRGNRTGPAAQLLREMDHLFPSATRKLDDPAQPIGGEVELAIPDSDGGMFISGWLRDPLGMIEEMSLATDSGRVTLTSECIARLHRPDIAKRFATASHRGTDAKQGFVAYVSEMPGCHTVQPHLSLQLRSGSRIELTPAPRSMGPSAARDAVLGCIPPGQVTPSMMQRCIAPAAARLHRTAMQTRDAAEVIHIGRPVAKPVASILIPLYRNLGFIRFQFMALAEDPGCRQSQIIFVLDSPEQRNDVEHLLRGLYRLTDLPVTLLVMPRNLGYAAANNTGAREAHAPILLLLNSDVVPTAPGWFRKLMEPFVRTSVGATGPKLLFEDGSIQHAGLHFERDEDGIWFNRHYHKGMPCQWPDAQIRRDVPGVTGAALAIRRKLFERIGGVCEDYIIGDYEDSDLCLRIRTAGSTITYVPEAELYHFERRSIGLHTGYTRTHAALYNRLLHHARWDSTITTLMTEPAPARRKRA